MSRRAPKAPELGPLPEDVVEMPHHKERIVFRERDPAGERIAFDFFLGPGGGVPTVHCHGAQSETLHCVRGEITVLLGDERKVLRAGDRCDLPPGTFHALANETEQEVFCRVEYRPAGKSEAWLKMTGALIRAEGREPGMLDVAPFINDVGFYIPGPPAWAQRALFHVLKPIAILLGRRRRLLDLARATYGASFEW